MNGKLTRILMEHKDVSRIGIAIVLILTNLYLAPSDLRVRLGEHTISSSMSSYATEHRVDKIVIHEDYDVDSKSRDKMMTYFTGDIALVRLDSHADISKYTPACLPTANENFFGKFAVVTG